MKGKFTVYGMTCAACVAAVERNVKKLDGVSKVGVNLSTGALLCEYDENKVSETDIINAVTKAGYKAERYFGDKKQKNDLGFRFFFSLPFWLLLLYLCMGPMVGLPLPSFLDMHGHALTNAIVQLCLFLPVGIVNYKYFTIGFKRLFKLSPNMDSLIATGAFACVAYSIYITVRIGVLAAAGETHAAAMLVHSLYFESAATIFTLVTLGKYLEEKSKRKTGDALAGLKKILPAEATVIENGNKTVKPLSQIKVGELVFVKEGEGVSLDGVVEDGEGSVNQAAVTGESIPVYKKAGDAVLSGGVLESGYLIIRVTATGENSTLSRIINMVEEAGASKAPVSKLADKIAAIFVPTVIGLALLTFIIWIAVTGDFQTAFTRGVSVLVVSCPCALGLATPLAVMLGTGKGAEHGVLIRSGEALQKLAEINAVAFDKTGTLTEGKPKVADFKALADEKQALETAKALEMHSSHPLAKAITEFCNERGADMADCSLAESLHGRGVKGVVSGEECYAVSYSFVRDNGLIGGDLQLAKDLYEQFATKGETPVFVVKGGKLIAVFGIADEIRESAKNAVSELKAENKKVIMITGDNEITAKAVADKLGIDYIAGVLPDGKREAVAGLKRGGDKVAFVGDGINDAPALAEADVGIAVGGGTEVAIENADVILMKNDPADAAFAIALGERSLRSIKQNLFWEFFYNCLCIPLAAGALSFAGVNLTPGFSAAMMSLSSLFVVGNSLRLRFFGGLKKRNKNAEKAKAVAGKAASETCAVGGGCNAEKQEKISAENINNNKTADNIIGEKNNEVKSMKEYLYINGMMCGHCKARVEKTLSAAAGVVSCAVELENKRALVEVTDAFDQAAAAKALAEDGYTLVKSEKI